jgi:CubicO group peptidase (beta-lactamase class C family)
MRYSALLAALTFSTAAYASEPAGLHDMLDALAKAGRFSGAVVIRDDKGVRFAGGYGLADPFSGRAFTPDTPVDSGSLAKPVTAAAVLLLARDGTIRLDAPVQRYLPEFPYAPVTIRHLLAHSAGLPTEEALDPITGKTNRDFVIEMRDRRLQPQFPAGSAFTYCNLCYITLALLIERVSGRSFLDFVRERVALPAGVTIRPARLADWTGRAIGFRRTPEGKLERADSYENELFTGTANFSISAAQMARWGSEWWSRPLSSIRGQAATTAMISSKPSGLSWGSWYCAKARRECHYLGHHEGFHHMLYWDARRRVSIAMVSNSSAEPALHQSLQRALVGYSKGTQRRLEPELELKEAEPGTYRLTSGERVTLRADGRRRTFTRQGISYPAYAVGGGVRYVPGLDMYFSGTAGRCLRMVTLYEDLRACSPD